VKKTCKSEVGANCFGQKNWLGKSKKALKHGGRDFKTRRDKTLGVEDAERGTFSPELRSEEGGAGGVIRRIILGTGAAKTCGGGSGRHNCPQLSKEVKRKDNK